MRKYIDKYFNWLGIKNEGIRRIIYVIHLIALPLWFNFFYETLDMDADAELFFWLYPILTSIVIKVITWIRQGFDKEYEPNKSVDKKSVDKGLTFVCRKCGQPKDDLAREFYLAPMVAIKLDCATCKTEEYFDKTEVSY